MMQLKYRCLYQFSSVSVENDIKTSIELNFEYSFDFLTSKAKGPACPVFESI